MIVNVSREVESIFGILVLMTLMSCFSGSIVA